MRATRLDEPVAVAENSFKLVYDIRGADHSIEYTVNGDGSATFVFTDAAGNTGFNCNTVIGPHDSSASAMASVNSQAAAARAYCQANSGAAPPSYFLIGDGPVIGPKQ